VKLALVQITEAFQARRAKIRYRKWNNKKIGVTVHTRKNGSGIKPGRKNNFAAILENYQEADGTVKKFRKFLILNGGITEIRK